MEIPDDFSTFVSAPTSPRKMTHDHSTPPMTPYHDANSDFDDFEFETSRSFNGDGVHRVTSQKVKDSFLRKQHEQRQQRQRGDSLPATMAFADELFCEGKVMPVASPLKLPPRLYQCGSGNQSPAPSSPRSPSFSLNLPFSYRRLWNDDFDPFMVAMESVREEDKRGKTKTNDPNMVGLNDQQKKQTALPTPIYSPSANSTGLPEPKKQVGQSLNRLALPKGLEIARQVRLIQMGHTERCSEPNMAKPVPTVETHKNKIAQESGGPPSTKETKGQKIKRFLFSASFGKVDDENKKKRDQSSATISRKPTFLRRLSFKSGRSAAHCNAEKRVSNQLTKMTLAHYRPRLLLCMGYRARYAK